jgi:hypothetical protein
MLPHEIEFEESLRKKVAEAIGLPAKGFHSNYQALSEEEIKRFKEQKEYVEQVKQKMFQEFIIDGPNSRVRSMSVCLTPPIIRFVRPGYINGK